MAQAEDYYSVLEVRRDANSAELKKSFRRLALAYHPDRNDSPEAEARFKLINEAYATLSDPEKRKRYDRYGQSEAVNDPFQGGVNAHDLRDIFGDEIFNNLFASLFGARARSAPPPPIETSLTITLAEVLRGAEKVISIQRQGHCERCDGSGGSSACARCQGRGQISVSQGFFTLPRACPDCHGTGRDPRSSCRACSGRGVKQSQASVRVTVPAGVEDGQRLRVRGAGHTSRDGGDTGDLIVGVQVAPHEFYERRGQELIATVKIPYDVATLGGECAVPLIEGGEAKVRVPQGLQPGKALRLKGKGLFERGLTRRGDLLIYPEVDVPKALTATERELLVALRSARLQPDHATPSAYGASRDKSSHHQDRSGGGQSFAPRLIDRLSKLIKRR